MALIDIRFFSIQPLKYAGQPVKAPFAKAEGLLYCLAANQRMSKEALCRLLWGDCTEEMAKKSLRNAIYILRKQFGEGLIRSEGQNMLALAEDYEINSDLSYLTLEQQPTLEQIADFVEFYQQDFLQHFLIKNAPDFQDWVYFEQEKYRRLYLEKLETYAELAENQNELDLAQKCLYKLISCEPYEERYYQQLITILLHRNKLPEALKLYGNLEKLLKEELLIQPSAELAELIGQAVRTQLITEGGQEFFFGREQELALLKQNFVAFIKGDPCCSYAFIGEGGIGKTRLIDTFTGSLKGDYLLLENYNYRIDKDVAYKMWEDIFQQIRYCAEQKGLKVPQEQLQALKNITSDPVLPEGLAEAAESQLEQQLTQLMETVGRQRRILLVVDDLHWADWRSVDLLAKVMLHCKNIMLLISARDDQPENLERLIYAVRKRHHIRQIHLQRFSREETERLLQELAPELAEQSERIYEESEGNPFFLMEMVNNYRAGVDISTLNQQMQDFIGARLSILSERELAIINICAVIASDIKLDLLSVVSGESELELIEVLEALMHKRFLREFTNLQGELCFFFGHHKIREYIYDHISQTKRGLLHEKVADGMEMLYGKDMRRQIYYPRLIYHYTESGNIYKVLKYRISHLEIHYKRQNEMFPVRVGMEELAISSYRNPDHDLQEEFAELERLLYSPRLRCTPEQWVELKVSYYYSLGRYYSNGGDQDMSWQMLRKMYEEALVSNHEPFIADACIRMILMAVDQYNLDGIDRYIEEAEKLPYIQNNLIYSLTLNHYKGYARILQRHFAEGEALIKRNIVLLESMPSRAEYEHVLAADFFCLGESRLHQRDFDTAENYLLSARRYCRTNNVNTSQAIINLGLGLIKYARGEYETAAQILRLSEENYLRNNFIWYRVTLYCYLAKTMLKLNRPTEALSYAEKSRHLYHIPSQSFETQAVESMQKALAQAGLTLSK